MCTDSTYSFLLLSMDTFNAGSKYFYDPWRVISIVGVYTDTDEIA